MGELGSWPMMSTPLALPRVAPTGGSLSPELGWVARASVMPGRELSSVAEASTPSYHLRISQSCFLHGLPDPWRVHQMFLYRHIASLMKYS